MRRYFSNGTPLKGGQKKLDVDGDGKITGKDFAMLQESNARRNNKKITKKQKPSMMAMAIKGKR